MLDGLLTLPEQIAPLLPMIGGVLGGAILLFLLVTTLTGGILLGPWLAITTVGLGALTGSMMLFALTRRLGGERLRARFGARLAPLEARLAAYGPYAVAALRVAGAPGPLITAGAAMTAMKRTPFAIATLAGLLPSVILAAAGPSFLLG